VSVCVSHVCECVCESCVNLRSTIAYSAAELALETRGWFSPQTQVVAVPRRMYSIYTGSLLVF